MFVQNEERNGCTRSSMEITYYERLLRDLLRLTYNVDRVRCVGNFRDSFGFFRIHQSHPALSL